MTGVKFNFDNDFEADKAQEAQEEAITLERQLRESYESGYKDGHTAGETARMQATEQHISELMESIITKLAALGSRHEEMEGRLQRDSVQLAFIISKKLASAALDKYPASEIEAMIRECFEVGREEAKLVVRVAEDLIESVAAKCEEIRTRSSFSGEVIVIGDPDIARNDCIVEWPDGGAEHRTETSLDTIEHLIQDFMFQRPDEFSASAPSETPDTSATETGEFQSADESAEEVVEEAQAAGPAEPMEQPEITAKPENAENIEAAN